MQALVINLLGCIWYYTARVGGIRPGHTWLADVCERLPVITTACKHATRLCSQLARLATSSLASLTSIVNRTWGLARSIANQR
jgi:hypothetical protein